MIKLKNLAFIFVVVLLIGCSVAIDYSKEYTNENKKVKITEYVTGLEEEKQSRRSEILNNYIDGKITKEEGQEQLKLLSCEIAERSGSKYNVEVCYGS